MVGPFAGLFCCERYCCEINCGTRPLKLLKGTNPFIWYPAIIIDILELSLSLLWNFILWKISNQSFIFIRSDQKDFVKRGGTNPKAKYYEYLSPRAFLETAPPWTMFAFCSTKDNVGCSYDSSSKKSFAHSKSDQIISNFENHKSSRKTFVIDSHRIKQDYGVILVSGKPMTSTAGNIDDREL